MMTKLFLILFSCLLQGCAVFWPYKSDFKCKIPSGVHCQSLYTTNQKADRGEYAPQHDNVAGEKI